MTRSPSKWTQAVRVTIDGDEYVQCLADFASVDVGIGPYEAHGYRGNDVNYQPEVLDVRRGTDSIMADLDDDQILAIEEQADQPDSDD